jgi:hypothetical protein
MCSISLATKCPQMKRGFMSSPGFSSSSNMAHSAPNANSVISSVGARNSTRIVKTMLMSIRIGSSPCRPSSLCGLLLPESGLRLPGSGWKFPDFGLQLPDPRFPSPNPGLSSPLARITLLASSSLISPLLPLSSLGNRLSYHVALAWSWAKNG